MEPGGILVELGTYRWNSMKYWWNWGYMVELAGVFIGGFVQDCFCTFTEYTVCRT